MRKLEVKIRQIIWSIINAFRPTNYDMVIYKGEKYYIKTSLTGENVWNLFKISSDEIAFYRINGREFNIIHSIRRFISVFKCNMRFQESAWGLIDRQNPLGTRLSYKNSENIYFRNYFN